MRFAPFLLLLFALRLPAQGYGFRHCSMSDGLPQNTVTAICEDSEGFLWVGTQEGLCRYDGYTFTVFRHETANAKSLPDNYVLAVFEDSRKQLWIGCRSGICCFDRHSGQFRAVKIETQQAIFPCREFVFRDDGKKTEVHVSRFTFREKNDSVLEVLNVQKAMPLHFPGNPLSTLLLGDSGIVNTQGSLLYPFTGRPGKAIPAFDEKGNLWVCTTDYLQRFDEHSKRFVPYSPAWGFDIPTAFLFDHSGRAWVGTNKGCWLSDAEKTSWIKVDAPASPGEEPVNVLYEDREGLIWTGTLYAGLYGYDPASEKFAHSERLSLPKLTWSFCEPLPGELWVGTGNGLHVFKKKNTNAAWSADPSLSNTLVSVKRKNTEELEGLTISVLLADDSLVWIGTKERGLYVYDLQKGKMRVHFTEKSEHPICSNLVLCLLKDNKGKVYAGTGQGISVIDTQSWRAETISPQVLSGGKNGDYTMSLYLDKDVLWAGTISGIFEYDQLSKTTRSYVHLADDPASLPNNVICSIIPGKGALFYLATMGEGLIAFDRQQATFQTFGKEKGLSSNSVYSLLPDANGNFWAGTNDGLALFDPASGLTEMFGSKDGIGFPEFSQNAWYKSLDGELFFGGTQGFICFQPERILRAAVQPEIVLSSLSINYQPLPPAARNITGSRTQPTRIELWPGDRVLTLEFAGTGKGSRTCHYAFRLKGFDEQWVIPANGSRSASYTNLPPGEYTLEISASLRADGKQASLYRFAVIVHPPFYATWWFRLLAALFMATLIAFIVRYFSQRKLRGKLRELQTQRRIQEERERISRDLHDNVGAQLTYIIATIDNVSWKMESPGQEKASKHKLDELGEQARHTMQQLRDSIWAIDSETISAEELLAKTRDFMRRLAEQEETIVCEAELEGKSVTLKPTVAIQLFRIIQEAVSNAFKHSGADLIRVKILVNEDGLQLRISDNGKGFDPGSEKKGHYGLKNMPLRAQQINGSLKIESGSGKGTLVLLTLAKEFF